MSMDTKNTEQNSEIKRKRYKRFALFVAAFLILGCTETKYANNIISAQAHSGRTDAQGGHRDNKNKSGLGSYHYHHGYAAHLHPGGVCPYSNNSSSEVTTRQNDATETKAAPVLKADDYKLIFDTAFYFTNNPDLQTTLGNDEQKLLEHFVNNGMAEGRKACSTFDVKIYKDNNSDLAELYGDDLKKYYEHYMNCGYKEERIHN